jgi:hypothetical protein
MEKKRARRVVQENSTLKWFWYVKATGSNVRGNLGHKKWARLGRCGVE